MFALAGYIAVADVYFGLRVALRTPVSYVGTGVDPQIFIWSFAWWPHALLHAENPFVSHAIWAPTGVNLAWTTSVPGLALLFAPLTLLAGPVTAYNVAAVLMPAIAAWTCFLLCRHLTRSTWPSLVGGYLFGFSSYMLGQQEGHLHLTSVFLVPLVALTLVSRLEDAISDRRFMLRLGALLALQVWFSTEVFFTLTLSIVAGWAIAAAAIRSLRPALKALLPPLAGAYLIAFLLASPLAYYAARGFDSHSINAPRSFAADLLNLLVPTTLSLASVGRTGGVAAHFLGNNSERGAYLGFPVLLIVVLFARSRWRTPGGRFLLLSLAAAVIAELGASLRVEGNRLLPLPWSLIDRYPLFDNVLPARLALFASLATAVIVALWAGSSRLWWSRTVVPALAAIALLPHPGSHAWITQPDNPAFITTGVYRTCLQRGTRTIVVPFGSRGDSMLWQAETGFWFTMAGGYLSPAVPTPFERFRVAHPRLAKSTRTRDIVDLARAKNVQTIIVDAQHSSPWRTLLPVRPISVAGVLLDRLSGNKPTLGGCGPDTIGPHNLTGHDQGTSGGDLVHPRLTVADLESFAAVMPVRPRLSKSDLAAVARWVHSRR